MSDALGAGIDVRGFFHWTGVDNYEWLHGYDLAFGLIDRDRVVRPSAQVLARDQREVVLHHVLVGPGQHDHVDGVYRGRLDAHAYLSF